MILQIIKLRSLSQIEERKYVIITGWLSEFIGKSGENTEGIGMRRNSGESSKRVYIISECWFKVNREPVRKVIFHSHSQ